MEKQIRVKLIFLLICTLFISCFGISCFAKGSAPNIDDALELVPKEYKEHFENGIDLSDFINGILQSSAGICTKTFSSIIVICLVSMVLTSLSSGFIPIPARDIVTSCACALYVYPMIFSQINSISEMTDKLLSFMTGFSVFSVGIFTVCGYVATAAASSAWISIVTTASQWMISAVLFPTLKMHCALTLADSTVCASKLSSMRGLLKSLFLWTCLAITTTVTLIMNTQTAITKATDATSAHAIKLAATQAFPIVGSFVNESLQSLVGSAKAVAGAGSWISILVILMIIIVPLSKLLAMKIGISIARIGCDLMDASAIKGVLDGASSVLNFMLAGVGMSSSLFAICVISFFTHSMGVTL